MRFAFCISLVFAGLAGCRKQAESSSAPEVLRIIGRTGSGPGEFTYPRPIKVAGDGTIWVIDRTGRVQHLAADGGCLLNFAMPEIEAGKPTGLQLGPDGNLWVADTHYHRIIVFTLDGREVRRFGRFGRGDGEFIYPTDLAFAPDGRVFVSEYGGNDRINVFSVAGEFKYSFGTPGDGAGQLSRPNAMALDAGRGRLYVADSCNHRIAVYDLETVVSDQCSVVSDQKKSSTTDHWPLTTGPCPSYLGSVGGAAGQLRYPYGLSLRADGSLVVCEFGNNRVQVLGPDGQSRLILGDAGREPGQLAFPWGVAADDARHILYVVDAGNNRVQAWRLPN